MTRIKSVPVALFAVAVCAVATGCPQAQQEGPKTSSPRVETPLRAERGFRKRMNAPTTPEQDAVFTFLDDDKQRFVAATTGFHADTQPSAVTKALTQYVEQLEKADKSALPRAFKESVEKYEQAIKVVPKALARIPDQSFKGSTFYNGICALFHGDTKTKDDFGGDLVNAVQAARAAHGELYDVAANDYKLEVDR